MTLLTRKNLDAPKSNWLLIDYLAQPSVAPNLAPPPDGTLGIPTLIINATGIVSAEAFGVPIVQAVPVTTEEGGRWAFKRYGLIDLKKKRELEEEEALLALFVSMID
jgi:hypothetical protein